MLPIFAAGALSADTLLGAGALSADTLQVFVLAGQSNAQGHGLIDKKESMEGLAMLQMNMRESGQVTNGTAEQATSAYLKGTLEYLVSTNAKEFGKLKKGGDWVERSDVFIVYNDEQDASQGPAGGEWHGLLKPGFGGNYAFQGGGKTMMGPELGLGWALGDALTDPVLIIKTAWGGKSLNEDFRPPSSGGKKGPYYTKMINDVNHYLSDIPKLFPKAPKNHKLAGFFWHQGWNDACGAGGADPQEYKNDLPNLIKDVRKDLGVPKLPVTIGVSGMCGHKPYSDSQCSGVCSKLDGIIIPAQQSVDNAANSVVAVETRSFHRTAEESPGHQCFHWNNNCESYWRVGQAMGKGMLGLVNRDTHNASSAVKMALKAVGSSDICSLWYKTGQTAGKPHTCHEYDVDCALAKLLKEDDPGLKEGTCPSIGYTMKVGSYTVHEYDRDITITDYQPPQA
jgi:alpha-galactosidase